MIILTSKGLVEGLRAEAPSTMLRLATHDNFKKWRHPELVSAPPQDKPHEVYIACEVLKQVTYDNLKMGVILSPSKYGGQASAHESSTGSD